MDVIKHDGSKEEYNEIKVRKSIWKAIIDAELPMENAPKTVDDIVASVNDWLADKEQVKTSDLKNFILDKSGEKISKVWRKFDERYKYAK
jgi:transcriptional regulator NrdR family protein